MICQCPHQALLILPVARGDGAEAPLQARAHLAHVREQATVGELIAATRIDNAKSLDVLKQEGLKFVMPPEQIDRQELLRMRDAAAAELTASGYIPKDLYARTWDYLKAARAEQAP